MSGPYGPNDAPGPGEGRNDPTQVWGGQQPPGAAPQWGNQPPAQPPANQPDPQQAQPTQQWGSDQGGQQWQPAPPPQQQQWSQPQPQPQQPQPWGDPNQQQWGQQPPQQQWGAPDPQQPQWSDPNQQQWGQQPQAQSGQWGQPNQQQWAPPQQSSGGGKKTGLIVGLALLAVVIIAGAVVGILTLTAKDQLDQAAVQTGVAKVLSESYGIEDVKDVECPAGQEVAVDATFTCDLKVGGEAKTVNVKITKDDGTYEVGRPS